jgi:hypothetical protein
MISWPITFTTYNGEQLTETFMFNLSKAELIKMQFDVNGAFSQYIERITNERNLKQLGEEFTKLILNSYGKKSDDGRHFYKSEELRNEFAQSEAYSESHGCPSGQLSLRACEEKSVKMQRAEAFCDRIKKHRRLLQWRTRRKSTTNRVR